MALVLLLTLSTQLVSCSKDGEDRWMEDLTEYVADIGNATALGIANGTEASGSVAYHRTPRADSLDLLSASVLPLKSDHDQRPYMVKSITEYAANTPEADASGLTKVTFTKRTVKDGEEKEVISQEEVGGEIDKLYILGGYTFVSYVPEGESQRPSNDAMTYDTDGIPTYDKCDYFSDSDRQSFIIDNATGYIYKITGFNIKEIQGGCLLSADDNFIYDFKINENSEVEIFSLFQNDTIEWYSCFKDKYGNKFIQNNRLNTYDATTNTYFYVHEPYVNPEYEQYNGYIIYELTSNNEAIALQYSDDQTSARWSTLIDASIILANGAKRDLTAEDHFDIYYDWDKFNELSFCKRNDINSAATHPEQDWTSFRSESRAAYKVENGVVYGYSHYDGYADGVTLMQYDAVNQQAKYLSLKCNSGAFVNVSSLEEHDILIEFRNGTLYYYTDVWTAFEQAAKTYDDRFYSDYSQNLSDYTGFTPNVVLENCSIDGIKNAVLAYGVAGNTYYDIVAEEVGGQVVINQYVKGTYQKPQIKVTLQPINKNP